MKRFPWEILLALIVGIGLGLVYAWMIAPMNVTDANPDTLRADFKDQYRSAIAAAYAASGNLPRAKARLRLLKDPDPVEVLNAQAQRMLAQGDPAQVVDQAAKLASALEEGQAGAIHATKPVTKEVAIVGETTTATSLTLSPDLSSVPTETPLAVPTDTLPASPPSIVRPAGTTVPTQGIPFKLTGQEELCDPNLPDGLLQVVILSSSRRQLPGMEIDITWDGGAEQFFTGLKPEMGNGYADFIMTPEVSYTVQLAAGSDIATGLVGPTCQASNGETFLGGMKLTFQQP